MTTSHNVKGGDNLNLYVGEWGNPDGNPILFIHGWSASHLAWRNQFESELGEDFRIVAPDLRGHGMSDAPLDAEHYSNARLWADDIAAIIEELEITQPVLVGWSYGGFIICDYLSEYGQSDISGVNFVGGGVTFNKDAFGTLLGPGFLNYVQGATKPDLQSNIKALRQFVRELVAGQLSQDDVETILAFNMVVPPEVRAGMLQREINSDDILSEMDVPVLVTQGREDKHCLPAMAEHIMDTCSTATASWYSNSAHMPFWENPERYNTELAEFTRDV